MNRIIQPIGEDFMFTFLHETKLGTFGQKSSGRIYIPNAAPDFDDQGTVARWAKVESIGSKVTDFGVGDIVLIAPLRWTVGWVFDDTKLWKSDQSQVLATSTDKDVAIDFKF